MSERWDAICLHIIQVWMFILIAIASIGALSLLADTVWKLFLCRFVTVWLCRFDPWISKLTAS